MAQYPIPQFIEEEGKIVFFMTFRQFFLLVGAGAVCFILNFLLPFFIFVVASIFVILLAVAIGFLKIENEPILKVLFNFLKFSSKTKNYVWKKEDYREQPIIQKATEVTQEIKSAQAPMIKTTNKSRLFETKKIIETQRK